VRNRLGKLAGHKVPYAHDHPFVATLAEAIETVKPTVLIGVSGQARAFNRDIVARMAALNQRPILFALSNPTSKAECTAEEAYQWTGGRAIFASGSPFPPVILGDRTYVPGQGNNVYIFPGVGLGALACEAVQITDRMFLNAARTLAAQVTEEDLALGRIFPALSRIRDVSLQIAVAVAEEAHRAGLARRPRPADLEADIRARIFEPVYRNYA
jgi:malate dehydrogenase (oxaloacetate-decarboxylating)(NADP+)